MRNIRVGTGPFFERPHFKPGEIERLCAKELRDAGLYPSAPEPIRIDRFIEKRFRISPTYDTLPEGVLGFTRFGPGGVTEIIVSSDLDDAEGTPKERRLRTTLAHEAGHGLCHTHLFCLGARPLSLFNETDESPQILCRDVTGEAQGHPAYDGRWWEYQANQAIAGLLMPRRLVLEVLEAFAVSAGSVGQITLPEYKKAYAVRDLAATFNVNPAARIRLAEMLPADDDRQLQL
jgi:hypothetical protein